MSEVRITVILPTIERPTLARAVRSAEGADEILVCPNRDGDRGYRARNEAMQRATGTHLAFLDDDDVYTANAIDDMRAAACDVLTVFKMEYGTGSGGVLWREPVMRFGNIGSPMLLVPNDQSKLGVWQPWGPSDTGGDFSFTNACAENFGGVVWNEAVVCLIRPE